jgi:hypothetical protein
MGFMSTVLGFLLAMMSIVGGTAIIITWMGIRYAERKRGLTKGATRAELDGIKNDLAAIRRELQQMRESQADLMLMLHDANGASLPYPEPPRRGNAGS